MYSGSSDVIAKRETVFGEKKEYSRFKAVEMEFQTIVFLSYFSFFQCFLIYETICLILFIFSICR